MDQLHVENESPFLYLSYLSPVKIAPSISAFNYRVTKPSWYLKAPNSIFTKEVIHLSWPAVQVWENKQSLTVTILFQLTEVFAWTLYEQRKNAKPLPWGPFLNNSMHFNCSKGIEGEQKRHPKLSHKQYNIVTMTTESYQFIMFIFGKVAVVVW